MTQSSVEWLANNLDKYIPEGNQIAVYALLEQAKAMHKEEIINAHWFGLIRPLKTEATKQPEDYYNENFKSE